MKTTAITIVLSALIGCGGGDSDGRVTITGKVGASLMTSTANLVGSGTPDAVAALPLGSGRPDPGTFGLLEIAPFDPDSPSFSISLDEGYDWVLFLVDSDNPAKEMRVISYVTVGVENETVVALPVSSAGNQISLGTLEANGDEATSGTDAASTFNLSVEAVTALAKSDDGFKTYANGVLNFDESTGTYFNGQVGGTFHAPTSALAQASADDFLFQGFGTVIQSNSAALSFSDICSGAQPVAFYPPVDVMVGGQTFGPSTPIETNVTMMSGSWCGGDFFGVETSNTGVSFQFGVADASSSLAALPSGFWRLHVDGTEAALFDFAGLNPARENGLPSAPVPVPELRLEGDVVTQIEIHWYFFDGSSYVELTQLDAMAAILGGLFVEITPPGSVDGQNYPFFDVETKGLRSVANVSGGWTLPGQGANPIGRLAVQYEIAGNGYRFTFTD